MLFEKVFQIYDKESSDNRSDKIESELYDRAVLITFIQMRVVLINGWALSTEQKSHYAITNT